MTFNLEGVDYAWAHPSPAALKAAGKHFASRYLSHDPSKDITVAELNALHAAGVGVVLNWESTGTDTSNGTQDAHDAQAQATALGWGDAVIYFSMDFDPRGREAEIEAYMSAVAAVIGHDRTGLYAGYAGILTYFNRNIGKYGWQTYAWSGGVWDTRAQVHQYQNGVTIGGADVDLDRAVNPDFGMLGGAPVSTPPPPDRHEIHVINEANIVHAFTPVASPHKANADGNTSLDRIAQLKGVPVEEIILQTFHNATPDELFAFAHYLGSSLMQAGLVYYSPR